MNQRARHAFVSFTRSGDCREHRLYRREYASEKRPGRRRLKNRMAATRRRGGERKRKNERRGKSERKRRPLRAEIAVSVLAFINAGRRRDTKSVSLESRANKSRTTEKREEDRTSERGERNPRGIREITRKSCARRSSIDRVRQHPRTRYCSRRREGGEMKDGKRDAEKRSPEMDRGDLWRSARADRARRIRA